MQINRNAAVIRYRESKAPRLLGMLSMPKLEDSIIIEDGTQSIRILFIDCQVSGGKLDKKRYRDIEKGRCHFASAFHVFYISYDSVLLKHGQQNACGNGRAYYTRNVRSHGLH
jgi:hypothetical protein